MKFEEILKAMRESKTVKRKEWSKTEFNRRKYLCLEKYHCETLWTEDFLADDWEVLDD